MKAATRRRQLPQDTPPQPPDATVRVLYIGGWGRSGSTLLDLILGQAPGVFSAGEVREIWQSGLVENRPCGCERPFRDCSFWQAVGDAGFGGWDRVPLDEILRLRYSLDRPWSFPALPLRHLVNPIGAQVEAYTGTLQRLYAAIAEVSGASVIVDSSNLPSHAFLLRTMPGIDLRLIHLVRDSRAVAYSWSKHVEKRKSTGPSASLPRYDVGSSSLRWLLYNGLTQTLRPLHVPYAFARYEDLVDAPRDEVGRLLQHCAHPAPAGRVWLSSERAINLMTEIQPPAIVLIGGTGRSGSTLLDRLLGELPGFVAVGELRYTWREALADNRYCGCGARFLDCPFWSEVGRRAFGGWDQIDPCEAVALERSIARHRHIPWLAMGEAAPDRYARLLGRYLDMLGPLYAAIREVSGGRPV